jgi:hypothetical protein
MIVICLATNSASGQSPRSWVDCTGRHWHADARGLVYYQVTKAGVVHRVYADPARYTMARRIEQHLSQVGLPFDGEPPVIDRRLLNASACYGIRSPYHLNHTTRSLDTVDWQAAVRQGVRGAMIRGFNGMQMPADQTDSTPSHLAEELPSPRLDSSHVLQRLVEQGVEDAVIEGFNQLQVAPTAEHANQLPSPANEPEEVNNKNNESRDKPADPLEVHLAEKPQKLLQDQKYDRFQSTQIGWYVDHDGSIKPLETADAFVIAYLEKGQQRADLWQQGETLHAYILYARYYEDALSLKQKYY